MYVLSVRASPKSDHVRANVCDAEKSESPMKKTAMSWDFFVAIIVLSLSSSSSWSSRSETLWLKSPLKYGKRNS